MENQNPIDEILPKPAQDKIISPPPLSEGANRHLLSSYHSQFLNIGFIKFLTPAVNYIFNGGEQLKREGRFVLAVLLGVASIAGAVAYNFLEKMWGNHQSGPNNTISNTGANSPATAGPDSPIIIGNSGGIILYSTNSTIKQTIMNSKPKPRIVHQDVGEVNALVNGLYRTTYYFAIADYNSDVYLVVHKKAGQSLTFKQDFQILHTSMSNAYFPVLYTTVCSFIITTSNKFDPSILTFEISDATPDATLKMYR